MFLPHSLSTNSLLSLAGAAARIFTHRHIVWLVSTVALMCLAANFPAQAQTLTNLAKFNRDNGVNSSGVTVDSDGNLYGTTAIGGGNGAGTIWEIAKGSSTITPLAHFNNYPMKVILDNSVIVISNGNLYGTTDNPSYGLGHGAVWELAKGSNHISILASFNGSNGEFPANGGLTLDSHGNIYGTTPMGGKKGSGYFSHGFGTVWEIVKGSHTITTLAYFQGSNGAYPSGGVCLDSKGNLYGSTFQGGTNGLGAGTVWEIAKGSKKINTLAYFYGENGASPSGGVTLDSNGNLYGTTQHGGYPYYQPGNSTGFSGDGTIWEIAKDHCRINTLAYFDGSHGVNPIAGVTLDSNGNLYGTTSSCGINGGVGNGGSGTVWELYNGGSSTMTLATFTGENGAYPGSNLMFDSKGNLYGTTNFGSADGHGTVFEVSGIPGTSQPPDLDVPSKQIALGLGVVLVLGLGVLAIRAVRDRKRPRDAWRN